MTIKQYVLNLETGKIELQFEKSDYQSLSDDLKRELKRFYSWSRYAGAWVSKSKNNHYSAINVAEKLGFTNGGKKGERLSFAEELEIQAEKAERRAERYEQYADNANKRSAKLQSEFNELRQDWSWLTQPIIKGHSGSESFGRHKERVMKRFEKGIDEYRKSEYFKERAETARKAADQTKLKSRSYLGNRIEECNKNIRAIQNNIIRAEENNDNSLLERSLEGMEYEMDKLAFFENCLEELGVIYSKEDIKAGYLVKIRKSWGLVEKANPKTVEVKFEHVPYTLKYKYTDIQEMKIPGDWKEKKDTANNPINVGDILYSTNIGGDRIISAYQVIKTTAKTVTIQPILIEGNVPQKDKFKSKLTERRSVKRDRNNNIVVNHDDWYLYLYNMKQAI